MREQNSSIYMNILQMFKIILLFQVVNLLKINYLVYQKKLTKSFWIKVGFWIITDYAWPKWILSNFCPNDISNEFGIFALCRSIRTVVDRLGHHVQNLTYSKQKLLLLEINIIIVIVLKFNIKSLYRRISKVATLRFDEFCLHLFN